MVSDKVYELAKQGQAGAGALIWQPTVEGMMRNYHDEFSLLARENPSAYKLIVQLQIKEFVQRKRRNKQQGQPPV